MTDLTPVLAKIDPLIRRMSSDNDNEALVALRMLERTLKGVGADFNDLAERVRAEPVERWHPYGEAFYAEQKRPKPKADYVAPSAPRRKAPRPAGPPLWEEIGRLTRLAWLARIITADSMDISHREQAAAVRAKHYSQPHIDLKPAEAAAVNRIFAQAWLQDLRPIADVATGDRRVPLTWTGRNRDQVRHVLRAAIPFLPHRDSQFAGSILARLDTSSNALSTPSLEEIERIDRILVLGYDLGARA